MGSYLFLTEEGKPHGLVVNNEDQLNVCVESAEVQNIDPSLVQDLSDRKKIMFHLASLLLHLFYASP